MLKRASGARLSGEFFELRLKGACFRQPARLKSISRLCFVKQHRLLDIFDTPDNLPNFGDSCQSNLLARVQQTTFSGSGCLRYPLLQASGGAFASIKLVWRMFLRVAQFDT
jgi:hypothetical protein